MTTISKVQLSRQRARTRFLQTLTIACSLWAGTEFADRAYSHGPGCGCERAPASPGCSPLGNCGCSEDALIVPVTTRKLSFAEKILKHFDRLGDRIEAGAPSNRACCSTCESLPEAGCGVEINEATCGVELTMEDSPYDEQYSYTNDYSDEQVIEVYEHRPTPAPSAPSTPSKPNPSPSYDPPPPRMDRQPTPEETFTPRRPNGNQRLDELIQEPAPIPPRGTPRQPTPAPSRQPTPEPPAIRVPEAPDPIRIPSPRNPAPSTPLNDLPDMLVDPFKDDLTSEHRRNRMNGISPSARPTRTVVEPATGRLSHSTDSSSRPNPNRINDRSSPVIHASVESVQDRDQGDVVPIAYLEPVRVSSHGKTAPVYQEAGDTQDSPRVKRIAVPNRR